jgi:putative SOS response-associated peptidase YedK
VCGRFTLTYRKAELLAAELGVPAESLQADYRPRYNIAPTDRHWIVRARYEDRELLPARWGLVNSWAKDRKSGFKNINARSETVQTQPAFRDAFKTRRCVVPADGFFEWMGPRESRQPIWFHRPDGGLILFAGLYESWQSAPGEWERTFTILTTDPNSIVAEVHNRMPAILPEESVEEWTYLRQQPSALLELLRPAHDGLLVATPVSSRVNSVKNDDPDCLIATSSLL